MNVNKLKKQLKTECEYYKSNKKGNFIKVICNYLIINNITIIDPNNLHIVDNEFLNIDNKLNIDLKDIKKLTIIK